MATRVEARLLARLLKELMIWIDCNRQAGREMKGVASYILSHQPKSFAWRARYAKAHPLKKVPESSYLTWQPQSLPVARVSCQSQ